jgi:hypothetical protein
MSTKTVSTPTVPESSVRGPLDRVASLVLPPLDSFGGRGTILSPAILILLVALVTTAALQRWGLALTPVGDGATSGAMAGILWVLAALSPGLALARSALLALVAWAVLILLGSAPRYRSILSAALYGEVILALQAPTTLVTLLLMGGPRPGAVPVPTGLDLLVGEHGPALLALARGVTPFHIAWVAFLAFAIASCARAPRARGLLVALILWSGMVGLGVARSLLTGGPP